MALTPGKKARSIDVHAFTYSLVDATLARIIQILNFILVRCPLVREYVHQLGDFLEDLGSRVVALGVNDAHADNTVYKTTALTSTLLLLRRGAARLFSESAAAAAALGYFAMADVNVNMGTTRKMSFGFNGKMNGVEGKTPFLIGVSGGTASGKSTVCKRIMEKLGQVDKDHTERQVVCISQDSFYRDLTPAEKLKAEKGQYNFDHPDAFNNDLILQTLKDILAGRKCEIPAYDYRTNSLIKDKVTTIYPADVVLFEGILVFYFPKIRDLFHMKLFVDTDSDTRLARRVPRDINERGRDLDYVLNQYMNFVKPAFEEFCLPTKKFADVIIPRGADNTVAIDLIVQHIRDFLSNRCRVIVEPESSINRSDETLKRPH